MCGGIDAVTGAFEVTHHRIELTVCEEDVVHVQEAGVLLADVAEEVGSHEITQTHAFLAAGGTLIQIFDGIAMGIHICRIRKEAGNRADKVRGRHEVGRIACRIGHEVRGPEDEGCGIEADDSDEILRLCIGKAVDEVGHSAAEGIGMARGIGIGQASHGVGGIQDEDDDVRHPAGRGCFTEIKIGDASQPQKVGWGVLVGLNVDVDELKILVGGGGYVQAKLIDAVGDDDEVGPVKGCAGKRAAARPLASGRIIVNSLKEAGIIGLHDVEGVPSLIVRTPLKISCHSYAHGIHRAGEAGLIQQGDTKIHAQGNKWNDDKEEHQNEKNHDLTASDFALAIFLRVRGVRDVSFHNFIS